MKKAQAEISQARFYDYWVVNDDLTKARERLKAIVLAERCRRERQPEAIDKLMLEG